MNRVNPYEPSKGLIDTPELCKDVISLEAMRNECSKLIGQAIGLTFAYDQLATQYQSAINQLLSGGASYPDVGSVRHTSLLLTTAIVVPITTYTLCKVGLVKSGSVKSE